MNKKYFTNRNRFTLQVAAATNANNSWALGHTQYTGTASRLAAQLDSIKRAHGGNTVMVLLYRGTEIHLPFMDVRASLNMIADGLFEIA